jgi:phenylpropionate dioxygenase-like ring-hydroxylating dioxygenase large terminal subunit
MFLSHCNELEVNHWKVLDQSGRTQTLLNDQGQYCVQDNICLHQGSRLREGTGSGLNVVCPYHAWSWTHRGIPIASGTVGHSKGSEKCVNDQALRTEPAHDWSGFLFQNPVPLADVDIAGDYELVEYRQDHINSSYIAIMDLFLDIDHIPVVHPKLYDEIDIPNAKEIEWKTWPGGSIQYVSGVPGSNPDWAESNLKNPTEYNALWMAQYPFTQFEWQPGAVFVMVNQPVGEDKTISHVFKYRDRNYSEQNWQLNQQVWETAWAQDRQQAELMEPGWRYRQDRLDPEKQAFRRFLQENVLI